MVINADCIEHMNTMPPDSVDSIVTDPPYHLTSIVKRFGKEGSAPAQFGTDGAYARASRGFMGKEWDGGDIAFRTEVWEAALRVAKPGAYLLAFGGTRTFHRMAVAIEDAGWEIRDTVMWVYGSGFPKSHNVGKGIDKAAGATRTSEDWRNNAYGGGNGKCPKCRKWYVSGSPCRCERPEQTPATDAAKQWDGWGTALKPAWEPIIVARKPLDGTVAANMLAHGTGAMNIDGCRVVGEDVPINRLESWSGFGQEIRPNYEQEINNKGRWPANLIHDGSDEVVALFPNSNSSGGTAGGANGSVYANGKGIPHPSFFNYGDTGSAARFFYCAKANKNDKNEGLEEFEDRKNHHPTVKPTSLMRYLCKLVTRTGGTVLDPFCGSGSTGKAAILEGFRFIGIEKDPEYHKIAEARINFTLKSLSEPTDTSHNELEVKVNTQSNMFK